MADSPCTSCGACCAAFRVDFHRLELENAAAQGVPVALTVPVTGQIVRMRGTDDVPPRCAALEGDIGQRVHCTIYAIRPSPCHDFAPYAALNIGEDACRRARRRHGLASID